MYRFGADQIDVVKDLPEGSIVVFCWGEIDCRNHVGRHLPYKECIDGLVERYLEAVRYNATLKSFEEIWLYNVPPPPRMDHRECHDKSFPFVGNDGERLMYARYMNDLLKESEFPVVDIWDECADEEGFLNEKGDGHVHVADPEPLINWIKKRGKHDHILE